MKKILIFLISTSLVCSCATVRTSYVVNDIPVEIIDGHEYFTQRAEDGTITMMEHKEDCHTCNNKDIAVITTLATSTGIAVLSLIVNILRALRY